MKDLLQELLSGAIDDKTQSIYTAIPCVILSVIDGLNGQMVNIKPTINQNFQDGTVKERPPILGVPVVFPASSKSALTFPLQPGDTGLAIFSMRSIEAWKSGNGYPGKPTNFAKYDPSDAIFIPGLQPPSLAVNNPAKHSWPHSTQDTVLVHNIGEASEVEIRLKIDGDLHINTNRNVVVNCDSAQVVALSGVSITTPVLEIDAATTNWYGTFNMYGPINHSGNYASTGGTSTFNGVNFQTHVHGSSPGPSNP